MAVAAGRSCGWPAQTTLFITALWIFAVDCVKSPVPSHRPRYKQQAETGLPYHLASALLSEGLDLPPIRKGDCKRLPGLTKRQVDWCKKHYVFFQAIVSGTQLGLVECQRRFENRRWNCPVDLPSVFGKVLASASREAAFVHGIESAGITLAIARTCSRGDTALHCGCDKTLAASPAKNWTWGSCSDNYDKGEYFTMAYQSGMVDRESKVAMAAHHNHRTGRMIVRDNMQFICKCHGLTGSCAQKTCWYSLPKIQVVGERMMEEYDNIMHVGWDQDTGQFLPIEKPTAVESMTTTTRTTALALEKKNTSSAVRLVSSDHSVDYCTPNVTAGSLGTHGRRCDARVTGSGGCEQLCCRRGYNEHRRVETKKCNCRFFFCCRVECQQCRSAKVNYACL